jgi:multidrug resistance efflux pump
VTPGIGVALITSPVNSRVTNLLAQEGDYAAIGRNVISLVDADPFWVDADFEETQLSAIREGDPAKVKLMGYSEILRGEVRRVASGMDVANVHPDPAGPSSPA